MFKLIVATLAIIYAGLLVFGAEERRLEDVARADSDILDVSVTALVAPVDQIEPVQKPVQPSLSESEAVQAALQAGEELRADRERVTLIGAVPTRPETSSAHESASVSDDAVAPTSNAPAEPIWYVTGSRVNLRAGPSTGNDVVGQLGLGAEARVLDEAEGWYQIRTADGSVSGWIFGKFLAEQRPG